MIRVLVFTCDKYAWALKGFCHQFNKYWSSLQPVLIAGYTKPDFPVPDNFEFLSISSKEYPSDKWSNGLIDTLRRIRDGHIVIMLEDYWLCRGVNHQAVGTCYELCQSHPQILRFDLTDDRQYNGHAMDFDYMPYYGYNDIVWTSPESPYQVSLQTAIWNRKALLNVAVPNESAWKFETAGTATKVRNRPDLWVLGTRQRPVRYANVFRGGDSSSDALDLTFLLKEDVEELERIGALRE